MSAYRRAFGLVIGLSVISIPTRVLAGPPPYPPTDDLELAQRYAQAAARAADRGDCPSSVALVNVALNTLEPQLGQFHPAVQQAREIKARCVAEPVQDDVLNELPAVASPPSESEATGEPTRRRTARKPARARVGRKLFRDYVYKPDGFWLHSFFDLHRPIGGKFEGEPIKARRGWDLGLRVQTAPRFYAELAYRNTRSTLREPAPLGTPVDPMTGEAPKVGSDLRLNVVRAKLAIDLIALRMPSSVRPVLAPYVAPGLAFGTVESRYDPSDGAELGDPERRKLFGGGVALGFDAALEFRFRKGIGVALRGAIERPFMTVSHEGEPARFRDDALNRWRWLVGFGLIFGSS